MSKPQKCTARIWDGFHDYRCSRTATKDGFCWQHHPHAKIERQKKSQERFLEQQKNSPYEKLRQCERRNAELEAENERLREALMSAEESLVTYVGSFGHQDGGKVVLKQVRQALSGAGGQER